MRWNVLIKPLMMALLLLCIYPAYAVDYGDVNVLNSDVKISNSFTITSGSTDYYIESINVNVGSLPMNDSTQSVLSREMSPFQPIQNDDGTLLFVWNKPEKTEFSFSVNSRVRTINNHIYIREKILFPISNLDSSLYEYLKPTEIIDLTPEIKDLASELSSGTDDLYEVEYKFAEYVRRNIEYDLGTITADVSQKSSWVLDNKLGVCDELTALFISLNRASGIPARFVSGVAFTTLNVFKTPWVPHAWAEVYFPKYGWVPYDVTYGQYGFIDAGHIKLSESADARQASVKYYYVGRDIHLNPSEIKTDVLVTSHEGKAAAEYTFRTSVLEENVGFGSYDVVIVNIENPKDYYVIADLYIADTQGISIIEYSKEYILDKAIHRKEILLKPNEKKTVYWRILLDGRFNDNYKYTMPITVYNSFNQSSRRNIYSRKGYTLLNRNYVDKYVSDKQREYLKSYSSNIQLQCNADKNTAYRNEDINISCALENKGDRKFEKIKICIQEECFERPLSIERIRFSRIKSFDEIDVKNIAIIAENQDISKSSYVLMNIIDMPNISIKSLEYPQTVNYDDSYNVSFILHKESISLPYDIKLIIKSPVKSYELSVEKLDRDRSFSISSNGRSMIPGKNDYSIIIEYKDMINKSYVKEQTFSIDSEAGFSQSLSLYFNQFISWIKSLFQ